MKISPPQKQPIVLYIEETNDEARSLQIQGELLGLFSTKITTTTDDLEKTNEKPSYIVLHAHTSANFEYAKFIGIIKKKKWGDITVLLTSQPATAGDIENAAKKHQLIGTVSHGALLQWLADRLHSGNIHKNPKPKTVPVPKKRFNLHACANHLQPAVVIFQMAGEGASPVPVWGNKSAYSYRKSKESTDKKTNDSTHKNPKNLLIKQDWRRIAWLQQSAKENKNQPEHLLDWDITKKCWVACRLHVLGDGLYWYTRDWSVDSTNESALGRIEAERDLGARFDALADYLALRWSINRVRLYQVARLPQGLGEIHDTNGYPAFNSLTNTTSPLEVIHQVIPRMQSGLGWTTKKTVLNWWRGHFFWNEFVRHAPQENIGNTPRTGIGEIDTLSEKYPHFIFEKINACDVSPMVHGEAHNRLLALVPSPQKKQDDPTYLSALLAIDRRHDHLVQTSNKERYFFTEKEKKRMAQGRHMGEELDLDIADNLDGGTLEDLRKHLGQWLVDDHQQRLREWHNLISGAIFKQMPLVLVRGGMASLSGLCTEIQKSWLILWQDEKNRTKPDPDWEFTDSPANEHSHPQSATIEDLFFVTKNTAGIHIPAGTGKFWENNNTPLTFENFETLMKEETPSWSIYAEQDFQEFLRKTKNAAPDWKYGTSNSLENIKSWLAIRLPTPEGYSPSLMVVHFGGNPFCAWDTLVHLIVEAAKRLFAPFMLAHAEQHERSVWAGAVMHEMRHLTLDTVSLLRDLNRTEDSINSAIELIDVMQDLSEDFMHTLEPGAQVFSEHELLQAEHGNPRAWLDTCLLPWQTRFALPLDRDSSNEPNQPVNLVAIKIWRRSVRVLLHNAFRHGELREGKGVALRLFIEGTRLVLSIKNAASKTTILNLNEVRYSDAAIGRQRAFVRQRIGLRSIMELKKIVPDAELLIDANEERLEVNTSLYWPITPENQSNGIKS